MTTAQTESGVLADELVGYFLTAEPTPGISWEFETAGRVLPTITLEEVNALGGGQFLYQFTCPDSSGAYNFMNVFLIGPAGNVQALRPAAFRRPPGTGDGGNDG